MLIDAEIMKEYTVIRDEILKSHLIFSFIVLSFFYLLGRINYANGFILGAAVSSINFIIMSKNNLKILTLKEKFIQYSTRWMILRFVLFVLALIISLKYPKISFGGTVLGLISIQMVIFLSLIFNFGKI